MDLRDILAGALAVAPDAARTAVSAQVAEADRRFLAGKMSTGAPLWGEEIAAEEETRSGAAAVVFPAAKRGWGPTSRPSWKTRGWSDTLTGPRGAPPARRNRGGCRRGRRSSEVEWHQGVVG